MCTRKSKSSVSLSLSLRLHHQIAPDARRRRSLKIITETPHFRRRLRCSSRHNNNNTMIWNCQSYYNYFTTAAATIQKGAPSTTTKAVAGGFPPMGNNGIIEYILATPLKSLTLPPKWRNCNLKRRRKFLRPQKIARENHVKIWQGFFARTPSKIPKS